MIVKRYFLKLKRNHGRDYPYEFFHFFWGYLLPAFYEITSIIHKNKTNNCEFYFESFGPILDRKTEELANLFGLYFQIVNESNNLEGCQEIFPQRWDNGLQDLQTFSSISNFVKLKRILVRFAGIRPHIDTYLFHKSKLRKNVLFIRSMIINKIRLSKDNKFDLVTILKRTTPDKEYNLQKRDNEIHRIGTERRSLENLNFAREQMIDHGHNAQVYEPGKDTFINQVLEFYNSQTIIAIRGAELSNVIWSKPGSCIIVIDNFNDNIGSPMEVVAKFLNLKFRNIAVNSNQRQELQGVLLDKVLKVMVSADAN